MIRRARILSIGAVSILLLAGSQRSLAQAIAQPSPALKIVEQSIAVVQRGRDLSAIRSMDLKVRNIVSHLTDSDHSDAAPWIVDSSESEWIEDLAGERRLETSAISSATGERIESWILSTPDLVQASESVDGIAAPARVDLAPPDWELANPLRALLIAKSARDLRLIGTSKVHLAPSDVLGFTFHGFPVKLYISSDNRLPIAVESLITLPGSIAWASRGDLLERTEWMNWILVGGIRLATQWDTTRNGKPLETSSLLGAKLDVPLDQKLLAPDPEAAAQLSLPGRKNVDELPLGDPGRPIQEIAPGIVQIPGSWYSTLVRQDDGIVVIDAPISNGYSAKVIAEAGRRFPGVPVKAVITTTNYFWHTAGLREYASRGIPIYALDRNAGVVRDLLDAPHRLAPDSLALSHRKGLIKQVSEPTLLGSGDNRLLLIPARRAFGQMLMVYFPGHRILHTAELVQPLGPKGSLLFPEYLQEVADAVHDAGIEPLTMIGMHMSPTPWARVGEAIAKADSR